MCQSLAKPSCAEYWHMGETPMRLANVTERSLKGSKRGWLMRYGTFERLAGLLELMKDRRKGCRQVSAGGTRGKEIIGPAAWL
jgi:acyl carrier protein phosphodiesterase